MRVPNLQSFAFAFRKRLIVSHLFDELSYALAKMLCQDGTRHFLILNRVVQQCCNHQFGVFAAGRFGYQSGNFEQVIDVWLFSGPFATLMDVPTGSSISCPKHCELLFCHFAPLGWHVYMG